MATGDGGAIKPGGEVAIPLPETNGAERGYKDASESPTQRETRLRHKQFKARNSLLTDLYKINHIKTIYNVFTASFILLFINIAVNDIVEHKRLRLHLDLIFWHFQGMWTFIFTWLVMLGTTFVLYGCFKLWAFIRGQLQSSKFLQKSFDLMCAGAYAIYLLAFLCVPPVIMLRGTLVPVTTAILIIEQLRMMMKSHAFLRSNLRNVLPKKIAKEGSAEQGKKMGHPNFKHFLYFHIAPTLVYRDSYPRTDQIRWKIVTWHFCEVLGIAFYSAMAFEQFLHGYLQTFWDEPLSPQRVLALFFRSLFPGLMFLLLGFYIFFHAWMNAFGEMLRFGDRLFYKDWWTTTTFAAYYRSWNLIVHDWMYEYLYLDMINKFSRAGAGDKRPTAGRRSNHFASKALVFLVSALFHEYVAAVSVRFLYPVLFVLFGFVGVALMYLPSKKGSVGNIFMWLALSIGVAILLTAYCIEYYARKNCRAMENVILDLVVPRSWTCNATLFL